MQGTWIGHGGGGMVVHYKLVISGNNFKSWSKITYTDDEPSWNIQPDLKGHFELSPVQKYTNTSGTFRNINFRNDGANTLSAMALTNTIIYDESGGLYVASWGEMDKK